MKEHSSEEHHIHDHEHCRETEHDHHHHEHECCRETEHDHHHHDHEYCRETEHDHHHHDHEHTQEQLPLLDIDEHEGALIGTVRCRITGEYAQVTEELEKAVKDLAEEIDRQGGIVGHIKAFVKEENRSCMLSLTEPGEVHRIPADNPAVLAEIANIIFGLSEEEFHKCLVQAYGRWLQ
ncbi:MAG: hypothetical protein LKK27_05585 [Eubacterium sp.]|jgi:hypothetical protein|nr:hypothetical protein [Eubacterium sp.]